MVIPWLWCAVLIITGGTNITAVHKSLRKVIRVGAKEILAVSFYYQGHMHWF